MARREIQWSLSRALLFERCKRAYYYRYYHSREVSLPEAPVTAGLAQEMGQVVSLETWIGSVVHDVVREALERLRQGDPPGERWAREAVMSRLREQHRRSWETRPGEVAQSPDWKQRVVLLHHYYGLRSEGDERLRDLRDKALHCVTAFLRSPVFRTISSVPPRAWLPIEKYASFRHGEVPILVRPDFACRHEGGLLLYDWKTGRAKPEEAIQLALYALFASHQWSVSLSEVVADLVYLYPELAVDEWSAGKAPVEVALSYVTRSYERMLAQTRDPLAEQVPKEDFPETADRGRCETCGYRALCG